MKTFVLALIIGVCLVGLVVSDAKAFSSSKIVALENEHRSQPLVIDQNLSYIAQRRVEIILARGFSHTPDGKRAWDLMKEFNYSYVSAGENLANGFKADRKLVGAWIKSPSHKANIVNPLFTKTGIGISGKYVVQLFAQ